MTQVDPLRLAIMLRQLGLPDDEVPTGVAVAICESGLDSDATHTNSNGTTDTGLFQINSVHGHSVEALKDPWYNAQVAIALWRRSGWRPWVCHTTGRYTEHLGDGNSVWEDVVDGVTGTAGPIVDAAGDVVGGITGAAGDVVGGITGAAGDVLSALTPDGLAELVTTVGAILVGVAVAGALIVLALRAFGAPAAAPASEQLDKAKSLLA